VEWKNNLTDFSCTRVISLFFLFYKFIIKYKINSKILTKKEAIITNNIINIEDFNHSNFFVRVHRKIHYHHTYNQENSKIYFLLRTCFIILLHMNLFVTFYICGWKTLTIAHLYLSFTITFIFQRFIFWGDQWNFFLWFLRRYLIFFRWIISSFLWYLSYSLGRNLFTLSFSLNFNIDSFTCFRNMFLNILNFLWNLYINNLSFFILLSFNWKLFFSISWWTILLICILNCLFDRIIKFPFRCFRFINTPLS
jgi:hypothetical protein